MTDQEREAQMEADIKRAWNEYSQICELAYSDGHVDPLGAMKAGYRAALTVREEPLPGLDRLAAQRGRSMGQVLDDARRIEREIYAAREDTERPDEPLREFFLTLDHGQIQARWADDVVEYRDGEQIRVIEMRDTEQEDDNAGK